jgi:hypothetical protein
MHRLKHFACAFMLFVMAAAPVANEASRPIAVIPFRLNGKLVSVPVSVNGATPMPFSLDTGASASVVDAGVAKRLGLRRAGVHAGHGAGAGTVRFDVFQNVRFALGGAASYTAPRVYGINLGQVGTANAEAGLLGYDFFAQYVVRVDYRSRTLALYDPASYRYGGAGAAIPIVLTKHTPHVDAVITVQGLSPQRRRLLIDSGSEDAVDDDTIARSTAPKRSVSGGVGLGKRFSAVFGPVDKLELGPYAVRDLAGVSGGVALIGSEVLRRFTVVYDYRHGVMYLEPPPD